MADPDPIRNVNRLAQFFGDQRIGKPSAASAKTADRLLSNRPTGFEVAVRHISIRPRRQSASSLLRALTEMERLKGSPVTWTRTEAEAEVLRQAIVRMDDVQNGADPERRSNPLPNPDAPVHKAIWRRMVEAYLDQKNYLIAAAVSARD